MNKNVLNFLAVSLFAVLISGCDSSSSPKAEPKREAPENLSDSEKASCEFKADQGDFAPSVVPASRLIKSHFEKPIDESLVLPVLATNAVETVRFAKFSNLEFYSVGAMSQKSCKLFSFLPIAGSTERAVFDGFQKASSEKKSNILGVYFSPENKDFEGKNKNAFILMREDTTRWTLVHEYMHHLFSKEVQSIKRDMDVTDGLDKEITIYKKVYEDYEKNPSNQNLFLLVKSFEKIIDLRIEILKRYTLEEITIESYLIGHYRSGKLKYVPTGDLKSAKWYINSSVKSAQDSNKTLTQLIDLSTQSLTQIIKETPELALEAKVIEDKVKTRKTYLAKLMTEVSDLESKNLYGFNEDVLTQKSSAQGHHAGCSHSTNIEGHATAVLQNVLADFQELSL